MIFISKENLNDADNALKIFASIDGDKMDIVCIGSMLQCYCNNNMNPECIDLFQQIEGGYNL